MPHLTLPLTGTTAVIQVGVSVSNARRTALVAEGKTPPALVVVTAIVDTGAEISAIDKTVLDQLGLTPTGSRLIGSSTTGKTPRPMPTYDVAIVLYDRADNYLIDRPVEVTGNTFSGFQMLLGTDVLRTCLLVYDGRAGMYALAF